MNRKIIIIIAIIVFIMNAAVNAFIHAEDSGHSDFIYASNSDLMLHGKAFRYVGANCYYLMVYETTPDLRKHVDEVLDDAKKIGIKVMRTWAFNDGKRQWNSLQTSPGIYKESTFVGLDRVIAKAKERNIYLILTLGNNWDHYGGVKQYLDWSPTAVKKEHNEFFTDENARQYFKDHIKAVLTRTNTITGIDYKDDPTILAWEIMNEPRVKNDFSGEVLNNWVREMSAHIKAIDKNHLVLIGCEGFYTNINKYDWKLNGSEGGDFIKNHSIDTVDIASFHLWPCTDNYCMTPEETSSWIKMHIDDAKKIGKPLILGEYGEYRGYNGDTIERDRLYTLVLNLLEEGKIAGSNFWLLLHNDYKQYDDGCGVYYPEDKSTIEIISSASRNCTK